VWPGLVSSPVGALGGCAFRVCGGDAFAGERGVAGRIRGVVACEGCCSSFVLAFGARAATTGKTGTLRLDYSSRFISSFPFCVRQTGAVAAASAGLSPRRRRRRCGSTVDVAIDGSSGRGLANLAIRLAGA